VSSTSPHGPSFTQRIEQVVTPLAQLVARLVFGQAFLLVGMTKLNGLDQTTQSFAELGIPLANVQAPLVAGLEFVGGILLIAGLGTRAVALLLGATMVVAVVLAHAGEITEGLTMTKSFADVSPLPFLVAMLWLLAKGAGTFSVDHLLTRRRGQA
jgi:putative oxidoreductase